MGVSIQDPHQLGGTAQPATDWWPSAPAPATLQAEPAEDYPRRVEYTTDHVDLTVFKRGEPAISELTRTDEHSALLTHHPDFLLYDFGPHHPLRPERIVAGLDLLEASGLWLPDVETLAPNPASESDVESVHDPSYVKAVEEASTGDLPLDRLGAYGLTATDNPAFPGMHHAATIIAGGSIEAVRRVMDGTIQHAFNPAGGWHHAHRARASGFCVYNDPAMAAALAARDQGARVAYLDFDCHHGDGVQWIFYRDPGVLTVSFHESGRFLFPGTGEVDEVGDGPGKGFSVNLPFAPFSRDRQWIEAVDALVPALVERYKPDILITNHGCDTHAWDPQTHMNLTTVSLAHQAVLSHRLAHEYCGGRWIAVGSGGYDWRRVVPRSWAILWATMTGRLLPGNLPERWLARWSDGAESPMPRTFLDDDVLASGLPVQAGVERFNQESLRAALSVTGLRHAS